MVLKSGLWSCVSLGLMLAGNALCQTQTPAPTDDQKKADAAPARETIAKPLTDKEKKKRAEKLRKELETPYKKWLNEDVLYIITDEERAAYSNGVFVPEIIPGTDRMVENMDNDYLIDRAAQKAGKTYSGVAGFAMQDASLQESMGPVCDRTKENLVSTDNGIIMARHRLMRAAKALVDKGVTPPGIDVEHQKVRSCSVVLPPDVAFKDGAKEALYGKPGMAQTTV